LWSQFGHKGYRGKPFLFEINQREKTEPGGGRGADSPLAYCISITGQHGRVKLSPHGGKAFFFEKSDGRFFRPERDSKTAYRYEGKNHRVVGVVFMRLMLR
jgi:hypothetical protein